MLSALLAAAAIATVPESAIHHYALKGAPFGVVATRDSRHLFVATAQGEKGLAAYDVTGDSLSRTGFAPLDGMPTDFALTPDETIAVVAAGEHVYFVDTAKLSAGGRDAVLGRMDLSSESIHATVSPDGRFAFISEERDGVVTVIDFDKARTAHFAPSAIVGRIDVGIAPIAATFSKDGQWLYVTVQRAPEGLGWPDTCLAESGEDRHYAQGAVVTLRTDAAESTPAHAVSGIAAAGCNAVRLVLTEDGVTARGSGDLLAYDTAALPGHEIRRPSRRLAVGTSPVGVAVDGPHIFVTLSDRFDQRAGASSVAVVDTATLALTGRIPAGVFPREVAVTPDHRWLFISNFGSNDLEQVDLGAVP